LGFLKKLMALSAFVIDKKLGRHAHCDSSNGTTISENRVPDICIRL
jgi:hypothetical protein